DGWEDLVAGFDRLGAVRQKTGARVIVAVAPTKMRVHLDHFAEGELKGREVTRYLSRWTQPYMIDLAEERDHDWGTFIDRDALGYASAVEELCAERGLEFIDLGPGLIRLANEREQMLYWPFDGHWNLEGHAAAAQLL